LSDTLSLELLSNWYDLNSSLESGFSDLLRMSSVVTDFGFSYCFRDKSFLKLEFIVSEFFLFLFGDGILYLLL